ncbi:MAG TPA: DMT family transporter, partial [Spirochaetales bacterium]|nr:DMT family transporter [Spirochaetales bacterium]
MERLGELAAFGTAICWTVSALFFETASRRTGIFAVNFWKLAFALVFLGIAGTLFRGMPLPLDAGPAVWAWLTASGLVGFVIADIFLFSAYVMIGSRLTTLFLAFSPPFAALIGWLLLRGINLQQAKVTGPRWRQRLVAAGLFLLATLGLAGCNDGP